MVILPLAKPVVKKTLMQSIRVSLQGHREGGNGWKIDLGKGKKFSTFRYHFSHIKGNYIPCN